MTVLASNSRVQYDTNGTTGPFSIPFYFLANADVEVTYADEDGVETALVLTTNYSLAGAGDEAGGLLTLVTAYPSGGTITVRRVPQATQPTDYVNTDSLPAATLERSFDRATMLSQLALEDVSRAIQIPVSESTEVELPSVALRAQRLQSFDADGNVTVSAFTESQVSAAITATEEGAGTGSYIVAETIVATGGETVLTFPVVRYTPGGAGLRVYEDGRLLEKPTDYSETSTSSITLTSPAEAGARFQVISELAVRTGTMDASSVGYTPTGGDVTSVSERLSRVVYASDYGATGDGTTDDTAAIQAAIDAVEATNGGTVVFKAGDYKITSQLNVNENNVFLLGEGQGGYAGGITSLRDSAATRIFWAGSASSTAAMVEYKTPDGAGEKRGGGVSRLMLDCMNLCGNGLRLVSWTRSNHSDLTIYGATVCGLRLTTTTGTLSADPYDCIRNVFTNVYTVCKNLSSNNSHGAWLDRDAASPGTGNSCFNTFIMCNFVKGETGGGYGVVLGNSDNNVFINSTTSEIVFGSEDDYGYARYNAVIGTQTDIIAKAGTAGGNSSAYNYCSGLNKANGKGVVTVETGSGGSSDATVFVDWVDGIKRMPVGAPASGAAITSSDLDYYEEGTWTVGVAGTSTAGTATVATQSGTYVRVGRCVHFQGYINYNTFTGTGDLTITGLPYTSKAGSDDAAVVVQAGNLTFSDQLIGRIVAATSVIQLRTMSSAASTAAVACDAAAAFTVSGTYFI